MTTFPNPPIIEGPPPTDGQSAVYDAATNTWIANGPYPSSDSVIPIADPTDVVIDSTTYDNPYLNDGTKMTTLVFPVAETVAIAMAMTGDAFPRFLLMSDGSDGIYLGDGTFDPYNNNTGVPNFGAATHSANRGPVADVGGGLRLASNVGGGRPVLSGGAGAPLLGGELGDFFLRTDPGGANQTVYRCTTAGAPGDAVWTGIL